jgi:organic radical activating enzyme
MANKPFCTVPFAEGFSASGSAFRNCCATSPQITSVPGQTFTQWQQNPKLIQFKKNMYNNQWPDECHMCRHQEEQSGHSFRTAVNAAVDLDKNFGIWPSRWNLIFGNVCNLACWTCDEYSSSVIAQHKRTINILPNNFVDPGETFESHWATLEQDVLKSYDYHDLVTLTLLGGEPLYNKTVSDFLNRLKATGLAPRTRLEFHTNATKINKKLFSDNAWNYVCVFLSLDAIGKKAEWLRYGCRWNDIVSNIDFFKSASNYTEVHCTLSILNINDLPELDKFCKSVDLPLRIALLATPEFMSISKWSGNRDLITDPGYLEQHGFGYYYDQIGTQPDPTSVSNLKKYINQFDPIRKSLTYSDDRLATAIQST